MARALNRHDNAQVNLLVNSRTGTNGVEAIADNAVYGQAVTTRDSLGTSTEKAEASGYITDAAWTASTALRMMAALRLQVSLIVMLAYKGS